VAITVRPAAAADQETIVRIIRAAQINPLDLKWQHFVVAVDTATGEIVGTGQIKQHRDGSYELASIATVPAYRRQGVARHVIEDLLAGHPGVIYLTCMDTLEKFYEPFGFRTIPAGEMTPYFRRLKKVASALEFLSAHGRQLLVMKREAL
jgi:N-acetylglutamate synthase-like GNAT family acetyltransferase